jgi:hypothetical protein
MAFEVRKSKTLISLLKGPLYRESSPIIWHDLMFFQEQIREYFSHLGLVLFLNEEDGFGFLKQAAQDYSQIQDAEESSLPKLIQQRALSFELSLLLVILRRKLAEHDNLSADPRLILDEREILQMLQVFLSATNNDVKQKKEVDTLIEKSIELGVLRRMSHDPKKLEVLRILTAIFDTDKLSALDSLILEYKDYAAQST